MTIWIYSGGRPSDGAKELSKLKGFKRCRTGKFVKNKDVLVNWGAKDIPHTLCHNVLNYPVPVSQASNKMTAFEYMAEAGVSTVPWCRPDNKLVLDDWVAQGFTIIGRQTLTGHSGHGIIIMEEGQAIQPALLYTKYIFKVKEYRVHVVAGNVVDTQQKVRDPNKEPLSWKVRSHENGFLFARNNIVPSEKRDALACTACGSLGLDFGAVDIVEDKKGELYVLEVNTAPGLEGQTISSYGDAFHALAG